MDAWEFAELHADRIRATCRKFCRTRLHVPYEEALSEAHMRLPAIFANWDGKRCLEAHVFSNMKWYLFKLGGKGVKKQQLNDDMEAYDDATVHQVSREEYDLIVHDEVQYVLSKLSEQDRVILVLKHVVGLTFSEIGDKLGVSKATACKYHERAIKAARCIAMSETE